MSEHKPTGDSIRADISGTVSGQVAVGKDIRQAQVVGSDSGQMTEADWAELREMLTQLRVQVQVEAPPDKKEQALERVDELEEAVTAKEPNLTTMEYVKNWFVKHLPGLAGSVVGVVVNPIVGKLVGAAGEVAAKEFQRRFGTE